MKIKIWGCRGSLTTPGYTTLRYGGYTTCLEIRNAENQVIVVDAGSGMRNLGKALVSEPGLDQITLIFTHAHWDHLSGFPFFIPAYLPRFTIHLCGGPNAQQSIEKYLKHQMGAPYFPVEFQHLKAKILFGCDESPIHWTNPSNPNKMVVESIPLNHPDGGYGFKFIENGKSFVFLTDNELSVSHGNGFSREKYVEFCQGADLLFHDAQYTAEEYEKTRGWGHSTYSDVIQLAVDARVKKLGLFHHDPDRTDDDLDAQVVQCRDQFKLQGGEGECFACVEGMTLEV